MKAERTQSRDFILVDRWPIKYSITLQANTADWRGQIRTLWR